jgi:hypothetical protein
MAALLGRIQKAAGCRDGAWDVFCWNGPEVLFAESKRAGRDAIRDTQVHFLDAALSVGFTVDQFLIVEWSIR